MRAALLAFALAAGPAAQPYAPFDPAAAHEVAVYNATLVDSARVFGPRTVPIRAYVPAEAEGPLPVVVWSHGGAPGLTSAARSGPAWGRVFASAGYAAVHLSHAPMTRAEREAQCEAVGLTGCETFKFNDWQRPLDLRFVLDALATLDAPRPRWPGRSAAGATS